MSELAYDNEIAPELKRLADRCKELGMPFIAVVEYDTACRGRTQSGISPNSQEMYLIYLAAATGNIDGTVISLARYARENGVSHNSIVLAQMGVPEQKGKS